MPLNFVAKLAIQVAVTAASMALNMTRKIEGPRLDNLKFTSGDYGAPLQMVWGKRRIEAPIFWAEDLREVKQQRKTKGGKYNDYTYYGTWAVALAGHEIGGVTRIWLDTHLAYDATGSGPITAFDFGSTASSGKGGSSAGAGGFAINEHMAIYYGTEDQEPDPRILATVDAAEGEGSAPAYRGTAYIVFKDLPLEKVGNRIPQVSVEFAAGVSSAFPYDQKTTTLNAPVSMSLKSAQFSPDYAFFMWIEGTSIEVWDVAARSQASVFTVDDLAGGRIAIDSLGQVHFTAGTLGDTYYRIPLFSGSATSASVGTETSGVRIVADGNGDEHVFILPFSNQTELITAPSTVQTVSYVPVDFIADGHGDIWVLGSEPAGGTEIHMQRVVNTSGRGVADYHAITLPSSYVSYIMIHGVHSLDAGEFVLWCADDGGILLRIDDETFTVTDSAAFGSYDPIRAQFHAHPPGSSTIWLGNPASSTKVMPETSLADLSTVRSVDFDDWVGNDNTGVIYDPVNHALIGADASTKRMTWRYLDRIAGDGVTLETICNDVADMVGVEDYDFSDLDQTVQGWSATQGQASNILEPLLDAYDSDIRPHDFTLQGLKRSGVSGGSILTERFVKADPRYSVKVRQAAELPRSITVTFADVDADQQPNTARTARPLDATGAKGEQSIDMGTWASDPDEARQLADRYFRRIWGERKEVSNALTAQHLALEPGDCRTLDLDGESDIYRCVRLTVKASGELATEWKYDHPSLAVIDGTSGAVFDGRSPSVVMVPLLSKGFALDIPLLTDTDNSSSPLIYNAAAPYSAGTWPGAVLYQAVDGEYSDEVGSTASSSQATWGYANAALPDASPNVWDRGSSLNVTIQVGTLTGTTEAAIDASPTTNLALIGNEIVNFTTATLEGDGTYTLSGFKRGRRGTEWATAGHADRDVFLLLDTANAIEMGLSEVGTNLSFKEVTSGRSASGAFPIAVAFTGASLKPYAPCQVEAEKDSGSGDWTLTWVRRTRVGGAWTGGTSIPLSENSEEYEVDILDAPGGSVVRTISALSSATATYTAAQQSADGGDVPVGSLYFEVYQISDAVDRGFAAEATA